MDLGYSSIEDFNIPLTGDKKGGKNRNEFLVNSFKSTHGQYGGSYSTNKDPLKQYGEHELKYIPKEILTKRKVQKKSMPVHYTDRKSPLLREDFGDEMDYDQEEGEIHGQQCGDIIEHVMKCKKCRNYMAKKFRNSENENLDIAIYGLSGVFVLFLLDMFSKMKK